MEVHFTPHQEAFIRQAIETGQLHHAEEAVQEALSLSEERERVRAETLATVDTAEASIRSGAGRIVNAESMRQLATEVKDRGRIRLAAEESTLR